MLRSTEAIMAGILLIFTLNALYKIPEVSVEDPVKIYLDTLLDSYYAVERELAFKDPYSLALLLEAALPYGYTSTVTVNIYKSIEFFTGLNYSLPLETYIVFPVAPQTNLPNASFSSNWYAAVFTVKNTGNESVSGEQSTITVTLYKPDLNGDSIPEPVDPESITVFTEEGKANYEVESIEDYRDRIKVSIRVEIPELEPGESSNIYVLYMVGDDYE